MYQKYFFFFGIMFWKGPDFKKEHASTSLEEIPLVRQIFLYKIHYQIKKKNKKNDFYTVYIFL